MSKNKHKNTVSAEITKESDVSAIPSEMAPAEFDAIMTCGLAEAQADLSKPVAEVFTSLRQKD